MTKNVWHVTIEGANTVHAFIDVAKPKKAVELMIGRVTEMDLNIEPIRRITVRTELAGFTTPGILSLYEVRIEHQPFNNFISDLKVDNFHVLECDHAKAVAVAIKKMERGRQVMNVTVSKKGM